MNWMSRSRQSAHPRSEGAVMIGSHRWWGVWLSLLSGAVACGGAQPKPEGQESLDADPPLDSQGASASKENKQDAELQRGIALIKNEKFGDARPILEKVAQAEPKNAEAQYYLGLAKER